MFIEMPHEWPEGSLREGGWDIYIGSKRAHFFFPIGEDANRKLNPRRYKDGFTLVKVSFIMFLYVRFVVGIGQRVNDPSSWGETSCLKK